MQSRRIVSKPFVLWSESSIETAVLFFALTNGCKQESESTYPQISTVRQLCQSSDPFTLLSLQLLLLSILVFSERQEQTYTYKGFSFRISRSAGTGIPPQPLHCIVRKSLERSLAPFTEGAK
jgi:hypothetical protein